VPCVRFDELCVFVKSCRPARARRPDRGLNPPQVLSWRRRVSARGRVWDKSGTAKSDRSCKLLTENEIGLWRRRESNANMARS
jgi:hypothetical protein